jgi:hypothetical protein
MDVIGFAASLMSLATLFSTVVECFEYFDSAKSFAMDYDLLLVRLDIQRARLVIWSDAVKLFRQNSEVWHFESEIRRSLLCIYDLLTNSEKLRSRYGLGVSTLSNTNPLCRLVSSNSMNVFNVAYARFRARAKLLQQETSVVSKAGWAIHDRQKFEILITDLKELIDGLKELVPNTSRDQDAILESDVASIDSRSSLRLVELACEGDDSALSDLASAQIQASEKAVENEPNIMQWVADIESINPTDRSFLEPEIPLITNEQPDSQFFRSIKQNLDTTRTSKASCKEFSQYSL